MTEPQIHLLIALIAAHFCGDFLFQTDHLVEQKKHLRGVLIHAAVVGAVSYLFCGDWTNWMIPVLVFGSHALIDEIKLKVPWKGIWVFLADQVSHLALLAVFAAALIPVRMQDLTFIQLFGRDYSGVLILFAGWVFATFCCGLIIEQMLAGFDLAGSTGRGLKDGGKWIGILERSIIFFLLLINTPAGIGFLITAKTIFRFGEIQIKDNRKEVEYILIGTLLSFFLAIAGTYAVLLLAKPFLSLPLGLFQ
jgi:hypothetical protein